MLLELKKRFWGAALVAVLGMMPAARVAHGQADQWKDRAEYDLVQELNKAADPNKKLELLNQWKQKYPESNFKMARVKLILQTYQQMGKAQEMLDTAKEIVSLDAKDIAGPYWITLLTMSMAKTDPATLTQGEKAANTLIGMLDTPPPGVKAEDWAKQKPGMEFEARKTIAWIQNTRKDWPALERDAQKLLELQPGFSQASFWLASAQLVQKKYDPAFWNFARAAQYTDKDGKPDPNALPEAMRKQTGDYLKRIYNQYHGDASGLDDILAKAKTEVKVPEKFHVESFAEKAQRESDELQKTNPQLYMWINLKTALKGTEGAQYFDSSMKDSAMPKLKGKIVSHTPALKPKELLVGLADASTGEITIHIAEKGFLNGKADAGTEIEFEGCVPKSFTADPFMLTCEIETDKITGWPVATPPPAKKAVAPVKKALPKKK